MESNIKERFCLNFNSNENLSGDSIMDISMSFDNPTDEILIQRLNAWLKVIGRKNLEVKTKSKTYTYTKQ
jgi:hypothetical protein